MLFPKFLPSPGGSAVRPCADFTNSGSAAAAQAVQPKETKAERASQLRQVPRGEYAENSERKDFIMSEIDAIRLAYEPIEKLWR